MSYPSSLGCLLSTSSLACVLWAGSLSPLAAALGDDDLWNEEPKEIKRPAKPQPSGPNLTPTPKPEPAATPSATPTPVFPAISPVLEPALEPAIEEDDNGNAASSPPLKQEKQEAEEPEEAPESFSDLAQTFVSDLGQVVHAARNMAQKAVKATAQTVWNALQEPAESLSDESDSEPPVLNPQEPSDLEEDPSEELLSAAPTLTPLEASQIQENSLSTLLGDDGWKTLPPLVEHANVRIKEGHFDADLKALQVFKKNLSASLTDDILTPIRKRDLLLCYFLSPDIREKFDDTGLYPLLESIFKKFPTLEGGFFMDVLALLNPDIRQERVQELFENPHTPEVLARFKPHEQDIVFQSLLMLPSAHMGPTLNAFELIFPSTQFPWFQKKIGKIRSMPLETLTPMIQELDRERESFERNRMAKTIEIFNRYARMKHLE